MTEITLGGTPERDVRKTSVRRSARRFRSYGAIGAQTGARECRSTRYAFTPHMRVQHAPVPQKSVATIGPTWTCPSQAPARPRGTSTGSSERGRGGLVGLRTIRLGRAQAVVAARDSAWGVFGRPQRAQFSRNGRNPSDLRRGWSPPSTSLLHQLASSSLGSPDLLQARWRGPNSG